MARQRSVVKLEGTLDDITFQKTSDGYLAKVKTSIPASKIKNDPAFARTRENNAEFGHAGKSGKVLRTALRTELQKASDKRMISRLTRELIRVLQTDTVNARGKRNVAEGDLGLLGGFDFNINGKLSTTVYAAYSSAIDRAGGSCGINFAPFVPGNLIAAPGGTTHFRIFSAAALVNFTTGAFTSDAQESGVLPWDGTATAALNLSHAFAAGSTEPLFLVLGIEFMQEVNGSQYPLKNGAFNALNIVRVDVD